MTKHFEKHREKEEKRKGWDKWARERAIKIDGVCGSCWQRRYPALLFIPPLWPILLLQSHGSGLNHCTAGRGLQLVGEQLRLLELWNTERDDKLHSSQRPDQGKHLKAKRRPGTAAICCWFVTSWVTESPTLRLTMGVPHCLHFHLTHTPAQLGMPICTHDAQHALCPRTT